MAELVAELARRSSTSPTPCASRRSRRTTARSSSGFTSPGDVGKVIGRQGRLVRALRTIVRAGGVDAGRRVQLEIVD